MENLILMFLMGIWNYMYWNLKWFSWKKNDLNNVLKKEDWSNGNDMYDFEGFNVKNLLFFNIVIFKN